MTEFLDAGLVDGVVNGGAAAGASAQDLVAQFAGVWGEALNDLRLVVERHHEGLVLAAAQDAKEKIVCGVLFKFDAVANAVGSIQQHANAQWQVGLPAEGADFLSVVVVQNFEVRFIQAGNKLIAAVENPEKQLHQVHRNWNHLPSFLNLSLGCRSGCEWSNWRVSAWKRRTGNTER